MTEQTIIVNPDGTLSFLWDDELASLRDHGKLTLARASDVEGNADGLWEADLGRIGGGQLGPFKLRQDALAAEKAAVIEILAGA